MSVHPADHILRIQGQLRSDMTVLGNVTIKTRVNGGAATTYTNVSSPAVVQLADAAYAYAVEIPASTYADRDRVEAVILYSAAAQATASVVIGPTAPDGAGRITVVSPVSADGATVDVYHGDDYANAEGRALTFDVASAGDLTAYTSFSFTVDGGFTKTATAVDTDTLRVADITSAELAALTARSYQFDVSGVKGGHTRTLLCGLLIVHADV